MEKTNDAIIAEIRESINRLRCELDNMESRLSEIAFEEQPQLDVFVEQGEEAVDIMLDDVQNVSELETFPEQELSSEPDCEEDLPHEQEEEPALVLSASEPASAPESEPLPASEPASAPEPLLGSVPSPSSEPTQDSYPEQVSHKKVFFESVMPDTMAWKRDIPGPQVLNILSAISLNDRVLFINTLFDGDPLKFQETVKTFNGCSSLAEVENYIMKNFPKWKMNSDVIYRFMMAVRRKLR